MKRKSKYGYFVNLEDGSINYLLREKYSGANWGDYHHHDMEGPYDTLEEAFTEAEARYSFDKRVATLKLKRAHASFRKLQREGLTKGEK